MANRTCGADTYRWQLVTPDGDRPAASNGMALHPTTSLAATARPDLLLVCGGIDVRHVVDASVTAALRRFARGGVPLGGLCTGSFALAAASVLRGRTCAIHWENLAAIQEEFPDIAFVRDLYAVDRDRVTCTGGIAPLSLMLAIVASRLGPTIASEIQAQFLVERTREGSEQQHARPGRPGHPNSKPPSASSRPPSTRKCKRATSHATSASRRDSSSACSAAISARPPPPTPPPCALTAPVPSCAKPPCPSPPLRQPAATSRPRASAPPIADALGARRETNGGTMRISTSRSADPLLQPFRSSTSRCATAS